MTDETFLKHAQEENSQPINAGTIPAPNEQTCRDKAQEVVIATERVLGEKFNIAARHELVNQIIAAFASVSAPVDTGEQLRGLMNRFLWDKYACTIEHHRMKVLKHFVEWASEQPAATSTTPVDGEREIDFSCRVCGVRCDSAPDPPARAVCPEHCEDHDYRYERNERGTYCFHCGQQAPEDWHDD